MAPLVEYSKGKANDKGHKKDFNKCVCRNVNKYELNCECPIFSLFRQ